jgi:hypothetical protein
MAPGQKVGNPLNEPADTIPNVTPDREGPLPTAPQIVRN